jgi:murein DD-endopeptidase MepM/ murein hydrolase activator NlpD
LNEIELKKEDVVAKGQVIAKSGNTGKSTAPHLHIELLYNRKNQDSETLLKFN